MSDPKLSRSQGAVVTLLAVVVGLLALIAFVRSWKA